ncbi:hypothetical protein RB597_007820 [Gaeumannomyces tritici]
MARLSPYLLYAAVAASSTTAAIMPDGTTEPPPVVQAAPGIESVPNTATTVQSVPARPPHGYAAEEMQKRAITQIQFWKERNFRGQYAITTLDPKVCYTFGGPSWTQWDKAIVAVNIASNGPCRFYEYAAPLSRLVMVLIQKSAVADYQSGVTIATSTRSVRLSTGAQSRTSASTAGRGGPAPSGAIELGTQSEPS